ncbi:hypothetical protein [Williamsia sterculiae]|nr:hypothetical protein [Williamsia sterculiae]
MSDLFSHPSADEPSDAPTRMTPGAEYPVFSDIESATDSMSPPQV